MHGGEAAMRKKREKRMQASAGREEIGGQRREGSVLKSSFQHAYQFQRACVQPAWVCRVMVGFFSRMS